MNSAASTARRHRCRDGYSRLSSALIAGGLAAAAGSLLTLSGSGVFASSAPKAAPTPGPCFQSHITQTVSPHSALVGATLNDRIATLTGHNPTNTVQAAPTCGPGGGVEFKLFAPSDLTCSGTPAFDSGVIPFDSHHHASASQATSPSGSRVATVAGTWTWELDYLGDSDNGPSSTGCVGSVTITTPPTTTPPGIGGGVEGFSVTVPSTGAGF